MPCYISPSLYSFIHAINSCRWILRTCPAPVHVNLPRCIHLVIVDSVTPASFAASCRQMYSSSSSSAVGIGNFLSLNVKKSVQNRLLLSNLNGLFRQALYQARKLCYFYSDLHPKSYPTLCLISPGDNLKNKSWWQDFIFADKIHFSITFRWQICHRNW